MANKTLIGSLLLIFLVSGAVYVQYHDDLRIRFSETTCKNDGTLSAYYLRNLANRWTVAAKEYGRLFEGTSKMNRNLSSIHYDYFIDEINKIFVQKATIGYIRGPKVIHTWYFDGKIDNIEMIPVYHDIQILGAEGKFYRYEVRDLKEVEESKDITSPVTFGKIKLTFPDGYNWAKSYKSGIAKVQYKLPSDDFSIRIRLFDPPELESTFDVSSMCLEWYNQTDTLYKEYIEKVYCKENKSYSDEIRFIAYNVTIKTCVKSEEVILFNDYIAKLSFLSVGYSKEKDKIIFDDAYDGNKDGDCKKGESCCELTKDGFSCSGYNADKIKDRFKAEWLI